MDFYVSRDTDVGPDGKLLNPIDTFHAGPVGAPPALYTATPGSDANWPNKPGTYHWQAAYHNCMRADPNCYGPIQSLTIDPLPPPTQSLPTDGATIPFGGQMTFAVQDEPSYSHDGAQLNIEFSKRADLAPDGTFAHPLFIVPRRGSPPPAGGLYHYNFTRPFTNNPGTYYWIVERFDCAAEPDCYVADREVRSFTVAPPVVGDPAGHPPHPPSGAPNAQAQDRLPFLLQLPRRLLRVLLHRGLDPLPIAAEIPAPKAGPLQVQGSSRRQRQAGSDPGQVPVQGRPPAQATLSRVRRNCWSRRG